MNRTPDAVVVGAGIIGAACAFRLAERGLRVVMLERDVFAANGSTGKSSAGVRAQFGSATNILLSKHSIEEYAAMDDGGYRPIGYLMIVPDAGWEAHRQGVALQRELGVHVLELTPQEAQSHIPFETDGIGGCSFCPTDGVVDPHGITFHYLRRARALGVELHTETTVTGARFEASSWRVQTNCGDLETPLVINAAGCWSGEIGNLAGLHIPVQPARRNVFASGLLERAHDYPMTFDLSRGVWIRSEGDRLIFGMSNHADVGWRETIDWDWLEPTIETAMRGFPFLERVNFDAKASWWGYYEITPDHLPLLGRMPGTSGWINACGFSGHGVMQAAATGRVIAQEALGEAPFINIDSLRIERFQNGTHHGGDIQL